uniref:Maternal butanol extracted protein 2 n=1 Tax=Paracentrotus lividus TaxID=7656 RepID=Q8MQU3_PARLI|nr:maternal butanol extracted protein 2 [Paracentrotus lividus]
MQSIIALLALLRRGSHRQPDGYFLRRLNQKIKTFLPADDLKGLQNSLIDIRSQDSGDDLSKLSAPGFPNFPISVWVDLKEVIRDGDLSSFTLCLPSNEAVQKWRQELPNELKPEALKQLVKAWIVPGMIRSSSVSHNMMVQSLNGVEMRFKFTRIRKDHHCKWCTNRRSDRITSSGIIHVMDKVIYPLPVSNVVKTLVDSEAFSVIVDLLQQAELSLALQVSDPITVLSQPTRPSKPSAGSRDLKAKKTKAKLQDLLKYHMISELKYSCIPVIGQRIAALDQGDEISVDIERDQSAEEVIQADIPTTNGVIHVIDQVLVPEQKHYALVRVATVLYPLDRKSYPSNGYFGCSSKLVNPNEF